MLIAHHRHLVYSRVHWEEVAKTCCQFGYHIAQLVLWSFLSSPYNQCVLQEYGTYILGEGVDGNEPQKGFTPNKSVFCFWRLTSTWSPTIKSVLLLVFSTTLFQNHQWYVDSYKVNWKSSLNPSAHSKLTHNVSNIKKGGQKPRATHSLRLFCSVEWHGASLSSMLCVPNVSRFLFVIVNLESWTIQRCRSESWTFMCSSFSYRASLQSVSLPALLP